MSRLILTDLDHTLLRSDGSISEYTLEVLNKKRSEGMVLAIATARYWIGAERYINMLRPDYEIAVKIADETGCRLQCYRGIAVANAIPEVLGIADEVTLSNDEDGVAKWIEQNL